ncbi:hypothetical protein D3C81_2126850 [compost metagenome]
MHIPVKKQKPQQRSSRSPQIQGGVEQSEHLGAFILGHHIADLGIGRRIEQGVADAAEHGDQSIMPDAGSGHKSQHRGALDQQ